MIWVRGDIDNLGDVRDALVGVFDNPSLLIGIPLALLGAVFMSFGAQYQHRGVTKVEAMSGGAASGGLSLTQLGRLVTRPSWVLGTVMLGLAIVCQLGALSFAPLIVVQPLGAIALVITTLLNARISGLNPTKRSIRAIIECVGGIFIFVTIAALVATDEPVTTPQLVTVLIILGVVTVVLAALWFWLRSRIGALFYIVAAGVMFGFVATLAKVVISRIQTGDVEWFTVLCIVSLLLAAGIGSYFVQTAYSSGPPDLVIAGLTVIDPIVAILIGLLVLGEAQNAPLWAYIGFGIAGVIAVIGVYDLARNHPQIKSDSGGLPITRGSDADEPPAAKPKSTTPRFDEAVAKVWPNPPVDDDRPPRH
ncbi:DMT family transporter [Microbacterium lemovicicum]|uniref:DMT family transporter n=1 Tax=Microbacterium lemovicicum TaxID=1072463 RepID=UPI00363EA0DA